VNLFNTRVERPVALLPLGSCTHFLNPGAVPLPRLLPRPPTVWRRCSLAQDLGGGRRARAAID
ncbi:unnamed protein product, partial [Amoebophrya sp. A25]